MLILIIIINPKYQNGIEEVFFIPLVVLPFSGWLLSIYFDDKKEKQRTIKNSIIFIIVMIFILNSFGVFTVKYANDNPITVFYLLMGLFEIWLISIAYTYLIDEFTFRIMVYFSKHGIIMS